MAGDWIPIRKDLDRCREVSILVEQTGLNVNEVLGQLLKFWCWIDGETVDGWLPGATEKTLEIASAICPQLVRNLSAVNWIDVREDGIQVVNFDHWFGHTAKRRLTDARRKRISRQQIDLSAKRPHLVRRTSAKGPPTEENKTGEKKENTGANAPREAASLSGSELREVFRLYQELFLKLYGIKPEVGGGKDAANLKRLLKSYDLATVKECMFKYFELDDKFAEERKHPIGIFYSTATFNRLLAEVSEAGNERAKFASGLDGAEAYSDILEDIKQRKL